jgi:hypothetical protein
MKNQEEILSLVRHTLTFVGGVLVANGLIAEAQTPELIGSITTLVGIIWGILEKIRTKETINSLQTVIGSQRAAIARINSEEAATRNFGAVGSE